MRRSLKITGLAILLPAFIIGCYFSYILATGNFHPITPGEAYRSAQPDGDELEHYIKKYNIRSVVNLRGDNPGKPWYIEEMKTSAELNVVHYDVSLSSDREPGEDEVKQLMEIFKSAPRPVLIHCQAGADRSGLVAAMWKVVVDKESKTSAEKQLSIWYGHIPIRGTDAMDRFFKRWEPAY
jgi:protein tyrosine/serine phosphatase